MSNNNKCGFISNDNNELCDYALKLLEDKNYMIKWVKIHKYMLKILL